MDLHPVYGPSLPEAGWVPAPSYLLRRRRILALLEDQKPGRYLEVGCGAGALLYDLQARGFECHALETSPDALALAHRLHAEHPQVQISDREQPDWPRAFDYLAAFEVLEHIKDDCAALEKWKGWLKPGGKLLLSVPAHKRKWNASDVWAGHYRRYERGQLLELLQHTGFEILHQESYGFPLANLIEPIRARHHGRQLAARSSDGGKQARSHQSGINRSLEARLYPLQSSWFGVLAMRCAFGLQRLSLRSDLGTGYLVFARLP
jgi:SAM-dependent methyltransferase